MDNFQHNFGCYSFFVLTSDKRLPTSEIFIFITLSTKKKSTDIIFNQDTFLTSNSSSESSFRLTSWVPSVSSPGLWCCPSVVSPDIFSHFFPSSSPGFSLSLVASPLFPASTLWSFAFSLSVLTSRLSLFPESSSLSVLEGCVSIHKASACSH